MPVFVISEPSRFQGEPSPPLERRSAGSWCSAALSRHATTDSDRPPGFISGTPVGMTKTAIIFLSVYTTDELKCACSCRAGWRAGMWAPCGAAHRLAPSLLGSHGNGAIKQTTVNVVRHFSGTRPEGKSNEVVCSLTVIPEPDGSVSSPGGSR